MTIVPLHNVEPRARITAKFVDMPAASSWSTT